jgi:hypothetical protein
MKMRKTILTVVTVLTLSTFLDRTALWLARVTAGPAKAGYGVDPNGAPAPDAATTSGSQDSGDAGYGVDPNGAS